ncbi:MAG TPA: protein kinase [Solirubrobacteraceae bacterium]
MELRERTLAGRYRLEQVIGRGGMSIVYRARDDVLGRTVAVKVMLAALAEQDPTYATRFQREARTVAALASPAVVTIHDTGVDDDGGRYIVMEYVQGRSLEAILADGRPLPIAESLRIAARVADALQAAHEAGILHRDIKPANVMVADDGVVKVLDFGIARTLGGTTLTQTTSVLGTAAYMAPERALGQSGDARADIYSLGCLLYAMLTGRPPFTGDAAAAVLHQQVNSEPTPPSRLRTGIPAALDALVLQTLAKKPEARPKTAAEVRDGLVALSGPAASAATPRLASTAATAPLIRRRRPAALLSDHRWRAVVMGLVTALVALLVLALAAGGSPSHHPRAGTHHAATHAKSVAAPKTTTPHPPPSAPAAGTPPGQGGAPPGKAKEHGQHGGGGGGPGGDGGD